MEVIKSIDDITQAPNLEPVAPVRVTFDTWTKILIESLENMKNVTLTLKEINSVSNTLHNAVWRSAIKCDVYYNEVKRFIDL